MKKNTSVIIGLTALLVAAFVAAGLFYKKTEIAAPADNPFEEYRERIVGRGERAIGPATARVVIVEFLDPECESCRAMHPLTKKVLAEFEGQVHFIVRYMPFHGNSVYAASALEAAGMQGKYWEALELIFEKQPEWGSHAAPKPELIPTYMASLGLDMKKFEIDVKSLDVSTKIEGDKQDGLAVGVRATPTFFVNQKMLMDLGEGPLREAIVNALNSAAAE